MELVLSDVCFVDKVDIEMVAPEDRSEDLAGPFDEQILVLRIISIAQPFLEFVDGLVEDMGGDLVDSLVFWVLIDQVTGYEGESRQYGE